MLAHFMKLRIRSRDATAGHYSAGSIVSRVPPGKKRWNDYRGCIVTRGAPLSTFSTRIHENGVHDFTSMSRPSVR